MEKALTYHYIIDGKDVSDILRGKIQMLDEIIGMKKIFQKVDEMEKLVKDYQETSKGAN